MDDPSQYLPNCRAEDINDELQRIGLPLVDVIVPLDVGASYHKLFRLTFSSSRYSEILEKSGLKSGLLSPAQNEEDNTSFLLRVAGTHMPVIKTANEVGILTYLSQHTSIPVPKIIHYDSSQSNLLRNEYMIMAILSGVDGSKIYSKLSEAQMSHILDQLVTINLELYKLNFTHIGGLKPDIDTSTTLFPQPLNSDSVNIIPGPPMLETMWEYPDIEKYFCSSQTDLDPQFAFQSLNAVSPTGYQTYTSWLSAQLTVYINAITHHPSLHWLYTHDPDLTALHTFKSHLQTSTQLQTTLNTISLKLAHRDLHFGNMLLHYNPVTNLHTITGILDWEFAAILPFPLWKHSFLWSGERDTDTDTDTNAPGVHIPERQRRADLYRIWCDKVARSDDRRATTGAEGDETSGDGASEGEGQRMLRDMQWQNPQQETAWDVVNYLRCVVEVCPRGTQWDDSRKWWAMVEDGLRVFGIGVENPIVRGGKPK